MTPSDPRFGPPPACYRGGVTRVEIWMACAVLFAACGPQPNRYARLGVPVSDGEPDISSVEIRLERTPCFGSCPAYTLRVDGSGKLTYTGHSDVVTAGDQVAVLDRSEILSLLDRFEAANRFLIQHACTWRPYDAPHATVWLRVGTSEWSFTDGTGGIAWDEDADHAAWHAELRAILEAIDTACNVERWIGTEEERKRLFDFAR